MVRPDASDNTISRTVKNDVVVGTANGKGTLAAAAALSSTSSS